MSFKSSFLSALSSHAPVLLLLYYTFFTWTSSTFLLNLRHVSRNGIIQNGHFHISHLSLTLLLVIRFSNAFNPLSVSKIMRITEHYDILGPWGRSFSSW